MPLFTFQFTAMGSPCSLQLYSPDDTLAEHHFRWARKEVERLEQKYSRYRLDSTLTRINQAAGKYVVPIDHETASLLRYADTCHLQSEGLFDITSGVLRRVWNFRQPQLPSQAAIESVLPLIGWDRVQWNDKEIVLPLSGMELDFGGIVKEYAVDTLVNHFRSSGVHAGVVELGGDVGVIGPHPDGEPWTIGVRNPQEKSSALATIQVERGAVATSGDYERYFELNGERFSHLLNPKTGWPVKGLRAVSVHAPLCTVAGSVTTIAMLKPEKEAIDWLNDLELPYLCISLKGEIRGTLAVQ
ncbi:MAG TPA: FAD:protein FMN transferase [Pseudomonadales bacterium]|nr:FAD:protein FMN transferase [Pseudomonadales bacterium]